MPRLSTSSSSSSSNNPHPSYRRPCLPTLRIPRVRSPPPLIPTRPFLLRTEDQRRRKEFRRASPDTHAQNVEKTTPPAPTCPDTSKPTVAWILEMPRNVMFVESATFPCPHFPCTFWPTTSITNAMSVGKHSPDLGSCKATCGLILVTSLTGVLTVVNLSPTDPISEPTCRHIRLSRISNVNAATRVSPSSLTWTSTTSQPASRTNPSRISPTLPQWPQHHPRLEATVASAACRPQELWPRTQALNPLLPPAWTCRACLLLPPPLLLPARRYLLLLVRYRLYCLHYQTRYPNIITTVTTATTQIKPSSSSSSLSECNLKHLPIENRRKKAKGRICKKPISVLTSTIEPMPKKWEITISIYKAQLSKPKNYFCFLCFCLNICKCMSAASYKNEYYYFNFAPTRTVPKHTQRGIITMPISILFSTQYITKDTQNP